MQATQHINDIITQYGTQYNGDCFPLPHAPHQITGFKIKAEYRHQKLQGHDVMPHQHQGQLTVQSLPGMSPS